MGASTFSTLSSIPDLAQAFRTAHEEAGWEYGHGGYTGSLAEKSDVVVIQKTPLPVVAAQALADRLIDASDPRISDKWGPAGAIPLADPNQFSMRQVKRSFRLSTEKQELNLYLISARWSLAQESVPRREGEFVADVQVVADQKTYASVVERTEGKAEIRYHIVPRGGTPTRQSEGAETLAAARANLVRMLKQPMRDFEVANEYEIVGVTRRTSGAGLVSGKRTLKNRTVELQVTLAKPLVPAPQTVGWLFFGWASD